MIRYVLALLLLASCEKAIAPAPELTARIPWSPWLPTRVGDDYKTIFVSRQEVSQGRFTQRRDVLNEHESRVLAVQNEEPAQMRVEVSRDERSSDGAATEASMLGTFELSGRPVTSVRRLDGPLSPKQEDYMKKLWGECTAADDRRTHERTYVLGTSTHPPSAEAECLGLRHAVGPVELILLSTDGVDCVFAYSFDHVGARKDLPPWHSTGLLLYSKGLHFRYELATLEANGVRDVARSVQSTHFTPGVAK